MDWYPVCVYFDMGSDGAYPLYFAAFKSGYKKLRILTTSISEFFDSQFTGDEISVEEDEKRWVEADGALGPLLKTF